MPSPQGELHGPHSSTMKLQEERIKKLFLKEGMSIYNLAISLIGMRYEVHNKNGLKPATYKDRFC